MKKKILTLLRFAVPIAIFGWLFSTIDRDQWSVLIEQEKNWALIGLGFCLTFAGVLTTYVRWYLLVRALELPFRLGDALRIGLLTYLLNFVSVGAVGGDLFKAFFLAREQHSRKTHAVATVVVDRIVGLYALIIVAATALLINGIARPTTEIITISRVTYAALACAVFGNFVFLVPGFTNGPLVHAIEKWPQVGPMVHRLFGALHMYRQRLPVMTVTLAMSIVTHFVFALSVFLIAKGVYGDVPSLGEHLMFVPLAMFVAAIPISPAGLGTFEATMQYLYMNMPAVSYPAAYGITVALGYRIVTIVVALCGVLIYWTSRNEVQQVMHEAEHDAQELEKEEQAEIESEQTQ